MAARIESGADLAAARQPMLRHRLGVRIWHWLNTVAFIALLVSGIGIILYHPEFYWGEAGYFGLDAWLTLPIEPNVYQTSWGRNIHFLFAWVIVINAFFYLVTGLFNGHLLRNLLPTREQLRPRHLLEQIGAHARFKRPGDDELTVYNVLQKMTYIIVIFVLGPVMLLSGMTMAPGFVAPLPELTDLFGGRQSARSIHFICANLLVLFVVVHVAQVFVAGAGRMLIPMLTGRPRVSKEPK